MQLRIIEGKSFSTISREIDVPIETLQEWEVNLVDEMEVMRIHEINKIEEENGLMPIARLRYLAKLYTRLSKELDSRDFSGLPTDKLYDMLKDVELRFNNKVRPFMDDWDDEYDDFDDLDDWDDDDDGDDILF